MSRVSVASPNDGRGDHGGSDAPHRILQAATALFADHGFEGTSMRDVALRAGVSKATVFHHFGTKIGLYEAVLEQAGRGFQQQHEVLGDRGRSLEEAIQAFARLHLQQMLDGPDMINLFMRQLVTTKIRSERADPQRASAENVIVAGLNELVSLLDERLAEGGAECVGPSSVSHDALGLGLLLLGGGFAYFQLRHVADRRGDALLPDFEVDDYCRTLIKLLQPGLERVRGCAAQARV